MKRRVPDVKRILGPIYENMGLPLAEIMGDRRVLIEQHRGVVTYGTCEVCVRVKFGVIQVCGSSLSLSRMSKEQVVISGTIDCVRLLKNMGDK